MFEPTLSFLALLVGSAALAPPAPVDWQTVPAVSAVARADRITALALDDATGALALGDERGVAVGTVTERESVASPGTGFAAQGLRRVARSAPVRDLRFLPASVARGALLAATADGVELLRADGRVARQSPGPGAASRDVVRIAATDGAVAVATADGVFASRDAQRWTPLRSLATGPASALALRRSGEGFELWAVVAGDLWRTRVEADGASLRGRDGERVAIALAGDGEPVDVHLAFGDAEVAVATPRALALRRAGEPGWQVLRPGLPPGARIVRIHSGAGRLWLATDRGLLVAPAAEGPWRRAPPPLGSAAIQAADADGLAIYVASADGVRVGHPASARAVARAAAEFPDDPSIRVVYQAALAYLRLQPGRSDALRRGVERRGWLPVVDLSLGAGRDDARSTDHDQTYTSGDTRNLLDRGRDRRSDYDVSLRFSWDLGDIAYHPEQIDVSRETRELIELRDDVLDEIAQLYFERRRVLAELAALDAPDSGDALRLRLRAAELAAGIDAWTGGWFSLHAPAAP